MSAQEFEANLDNISKTPSQKGKLIKDLMGENT
jgi:hypothetical protein